MPTSTTQPIPDDLNSMEYSQEQIEHDKETLRNLRPLIDSIGLPQ